MAKKSSKKSTKKPSKTSKALVGISDAVKKILEERGIPLLPDTDTHQHRMEIRSESSNRVYKVSQRKFKEGGFQWECSCPGWIFKRNCKHLVAMEPVLLAIASSGEVKPIALPAPKKVKVVKLSKAKSTKKVAKKTKKKVSRKLVEA